MHNLAILFCFWTVLTICPDMPVTLTVRAAEEAPAAGTGLKPESGVVVVTTVCAEQEYTADVTAAAAVADAVLTPWHLEQLDNGENIVIRIDVTDITDEVPVQDQEIIADGIETYRKEMPKLTLGMYIDISMFIKVGEGSWDAVTATDEPVEVVIGIPEKLQRDGRKFYIIRAHEGKYSLMSDLDDAPGTITVSTDLFPALRSRMWRQMRYRCRSRTDADFATAARLFWESAALYGCRLSLCWY